MNSGCTKYCVDTSALILWWSDSYSPDVFETIPDRMAALIVEGRLLTSRSVKDEIKDSSDPDEFTLAKWCRAQSGFYVEDDPDVQKIVRTLNDTYQNPPKKKGKGIRGADPFVIARAEILGSDWCVVSAERTSNGSNFNPNIPYVCEARDIEHIEFYDLMKREGWKL